jgi:hypothetical protein
MKIQKIHWNEKIPKSHWIWSWSQKNRSTSQKIRSNERNRWIHSKIHWSEKNPSRIRS